jgi:hypothetical protein
MIEFNGVLLAAQVKLLRRWLGMRQPSICVSMPPMARDAPAVDMRVDADDDSGC